MEWNEAQSSCTNVPAGLSLEVLTASLGPASAPQDKVQYVRVASKSATWTFPPVATDERVAFAVTLDVRFAAQQQSREDVVRSLPPLSTFPRDLFYPFTV